MTYATARRLSAAANLAIWAGLAGAEWLWGLSQWLLPVPAYSSLQALEEIGTVLWVAIAIQAPFDFLGGYLIPRAYHRQPPYWWAFIFNWLRGVLGLGVLQGALWLGIWAVGQAAGPWAVVGVVGVGALALLVTQGPMARAVAALGNAKADTPLAWLRLRQWNQPTPNVTPINATDPAFSGGWVGLPGLATHWMPEAWFRRLEPEIPAAQVVRRAAARQGRGAGVAFAMLWGLGGWAGAVGLGLLPNEFSFGDLLRVLILMGPWWLLGFAIAATLNRRAVHGADHAALQAGVPLVDLEDAIARLDRMQMDEPARPALAEALAPLPCIAARHSALNRTTPAPGVAFWGVWAVCVWLSWAFGGMLGRALAANQGRPELWVVAPGD